ncbi:MAG TPA: plastocyanin/azurin family copper-binding protein [Gaiellaceae bacterium]|jgi:uncharacterized cupredoxin-like copper-binding protein
MPPAQTAPGPRRSTVGPFVTGLAFVALAGVLLAYATGPAASQRQGAGVTIVTVTAGKPSELAFTLSKTSKLLTGPVTFKVTNKGALAHRFVVCATPVTTLKLNACKGTGTKLLAPGQSTTLKVTFKQPGTYEYLSSVPGQAAKGMKGLIGVVAAPKAKPTTTSKATTTPASKPATTPSAPASPSTPATPETPAPTGTASAGAAVWASAGCGGCHSLTEVKGMITPSLNLTHPGPFDNGPLTPVQISDLAAYVESAAR